MAVRKTGLRENRTTGRQQKKADGGTRGKEPLRTLANYLGTVRVGDRVETMPRF